MKTDRSKPENKLTAWLRRARAAVSAPRETVTAVERVALRLSEMRGAAEYEIVMQDGAAAVSHYAIRCAGEAAERVLRQRAAVSEQDVLRLLNDCRLLSWDGFHGAHPRGVRDGTAFSLEATVNGGRSVRAEGSQRFPKHYRVLTDGLHALLSGQPAAQGDRYCQKH